MAEDKTVSAMTGGSGGKSLILVLAGLSVVIVVVLALYLGLQRSALNEEQSRLKSEIDQLNTEIAALETQKVEAAQKAQEWLEVLEDEEVRWSSVLTEIGLLIPIDSATNQQKIEFLSYGGSEDGRITMNATTRERQAEPFGDVAELIEVFNSSSFFSDSSVPSITRGETNTGARVGSFIFNATYRDLGVDAVSDDEDGTEEGQPRVSRQ